MGSATVQGANQASEEHHLLHRASYFMRGARTRSRSSLLLSRCLKYSWRRSSLNSRRPSCVVDFSRFYAVFCRAGAKKKSNIDMEKKRARNSWNFQQEGSLLALAM